jgi:hypothetical protein
LALGLVASSPVSACRPSTGDLIRERIGRGGTVASVRAEHPAQHQTKARAAQRRFGESPHHAPAPPPVARRPGSSSDKFEAQRSNGRRTRDALAIVASARRGSTGASRKSTKTEDLLTTAPSAVFYEANAPPVRSFGVAGS